ncbi:MAG: histidine--tRNA ligase [Luteibaculaceae bacterium]
MIKVSTPKGTRDFLPNVFAKRQYIFQTIQHYFKLYGFAGIETPALENLETLTGKYGEEGDRLIFKVLNSGDYLTKADAKAFEDRNSAKFAPSISEKALRYDLTVPFARFVVQHQNNISFPFKRYQIQPVWRADRPQKGRYREFFQCDADVVGSNSLLYEAEFVKLFDDVLSALNLPGFEIRMNNRKILSGIAEISGSPDKIIDITTAIDKLDKIGLEKVKEELTERGLSQQAIDKISPLFSIKGDFDTVAEEMRKLLANSSIGLTGIEELETVFNSVKTLGLKTGELIFDVTLARGLNYYTGAIFEVKAMGVEMGSICGGGRYDDLTGIFGLPNVSGVGISFGADRIYDVMESLQLFPQQAVEGSKALFVNFGSAEMTYCFKVLHLLREHGIACELYPEAAKMKKQLKFADDNAIPFAILVGENEINNEVFTVKNLNSGTQETYTLNALIELLKQ